MQHRIILSGMGGQGVLSLGNLIGLSSMREDKYVSVIPSYGAEMRGGISNCFVTISDSHIGSPVFSMADAGIFMYQPAMDQYAGNIMEKGLIIYNANMVTNVKKRKDIELISVQANYNADKIGSIKAANMIMTGVWCKIKKIVKYETAVKAIREMFRGKSQQVIDTNIKAFEFGYNFIK